MSIPVITGAAVTRFGKHSPGLRALVETVVRKALADAGRTPEQIDHVYVGNAAAGLLQGQEMIRGQVLLKDTGLLGATVVNVENACASSSTAFYLAVNAIRAEAADRAIVVGAEQMVVPDKARSFATLASATDTERRPDMRALVVHGALGQRSSTAGVLDRSPLMDHYAAKTQRYLDETGATTTDLARVVVKSRAAAAHNPNAHFRTPTTTEQVLAARIISDPLRLPMCAPVSNGAAAIVVERSDDRASSAGQVRVRSVAVRSNDPFTPASPTAQAARDAFERGGVGPEDIDVAEVHDAAAGAELILVEEIGLCAPGEAVRWLREGRTSLSGTLPVNPGGGLLSRGHPIGATGCAQLVELVNQLMGRCGKRQIPTARIALAQNSGGVMENDEATATVSILERV